MDYHDNSAGTARLAVIKYAATVPEKQGTIFFNPGDPLLSVVRGVQLTSPVYRWTRWFGNRVHRGIRSDTQ